MAKLKKVETIHLANNHMNPLDGAFSRMQKDGILRW
jgi:hypothetical protein